MKKKVTKVQIFSNYSNESGQVVRLLKKKLGQYGFILDKNEFDLAIAVGGDGTFLKMVHATRFNPNIYYAGIHTGTLGFLQELNPQDIDSFLNSLKNQTLMEEEISIQKTEIDGIKPITVYSLNEIVIRNLDLKTSRLNIYIDNRHLEELVGDGIMISTTVGSTAYNLSAGGAIVDSSLHTLQLTPMLALNSSAYRNLLNSLIIPESRVITIIPSGNIQDNNANLLVIIDGVIKKYHHVKKITTTVAKNRIVCLKLSEHYFYDKVHDKFLNEMKR
ncbi:MAG: NAD(+)/NADH kinase [Firmicutes bacterium]|nr:NAD(+)/NADH kinase [Bacillota bacterium]